MVKYFKGRDTLIKDLEGDVNIESDCEGDSSGVGDGTSEEKPKEGSRAVLTTGSFSAYVRFLTSHSR